MTIKGFYGNVAIAFLIATIGCILQYFGFTKIGEFLVIIPIMALPILLLITKVTNR